MNKKSLLIIFLILSFVCCKEKIKEETQESRSEYIEEANGEIAEIPAFLNTKTLLESYIDSLGLVEIKQANPSIHIDLKYATTDNFTGKVLYDSLTRAYLHPDAMNKLERAQSLLKERNDDLSLLVYDAARPLSVQQKMYDAVRNTPFHRYVADPSRTSLHNYGMAVDLTICDNERNPLDMGTDFDYFGKLAGINNEDSFLAQGLLTQEQVNNRKLLREVMQQAGFSPIRGEWWHFNACSLPYAKQHMILIK